MAVPKKKRSLQKRRVRRSTHRKNVSIVTINRCSKCNASKMLHYACSECGSYK